MSLNFILLSGAAGSRFRWTDGTWKNELILFTDIRNRIVIKLFVSAKMVNCLRKIELRTAVLTPGWLLGIKGIKKEIKRWGASAGTPTQAIKACLHRWGSLSWCLCLHIDSWRSWISLIYLVSLLPLNIFLASKGPVA